MLRTARAVWAKLVGVQRIDLIVGAEAAWSAASGRSGNYRRFPVVAVEAVLLLVAVPVSGAEMTASLASLHQLPWRSPCQQRC